MTDTLYIYDDSDDFSGEYSFRAIGIEKTARQNESSKDIVIGQIMVVLNDDAHDILKILNMWTQVDDSYDSFKIFNTIDEFNSVIDNINTTKNINIDVEKNFKIYTYEELLKHVGSFL